VSGRGETAGVARAFEYLDGEVDVAQDFFGREAGFGLGFKRTLVYVTGLSNVCNTIPFPRTLSNAFSISDDALSDALLISLNEFRDHCRLRSASSPLRLR
jgi:hypothetical protein